MSKSRVQLLSYVAPPDNFCAVFKLFSLTDRGQHSCARRSEAGVFLSLVFKGVEPSYLLNSARRVAPFRLFSFVCEEAFPLSSLFFFPLSGQSARTGRQLWSSDVFFFFRYLRFFLPAFELLSRLLYTSLSMVFLPSTGAPPLC